MTKEQLPSDLTRVCHLCHRRLGILLAFHRPTPKYIYDQCRQTCSGGPLSGAPLSSRFSKILIPGGVLFGTATSPVW
ncbi:hypothetical protein SCLCIDRAFT_362151 [Scleroderma citrinum Foug A]|uniref:Uncharacterized protein n=1 Tax=Scleroderma citrinum Foug A TaxID=1036808 RepID=A0A0C2ZXU6_9AGAM|nr:hypothetical protein SCLCIDRAFT_362151 [Scleroderma citrinum Foug A]